MTNDQPMTTARFLFLWMLQVPAAAFVVSCVLLWFGPMEAYTPASCYLFSVRTNGDLNFQIVAQCRGPGEWTHAIVRAWGEGPEKTVEIDLKTMNVTSAYWVDSGYSVMTLPDSPTYPTPLTEGEVLNWMGYAGQDTTDQAVIDEATELTTIIKTIKSHNLTALTPTHFTYTDRAQPIFLPAGWFVKTLLTFWLVVWVLGFVVYFVIRHRRVSTQGDFG